MHITINPRGKQASLPRWGLTYRTRNLEIPLHYEYLTITHTMNAQNGVLRNVQIYALDVTL